MSTLGDIRRSFLPLGWTAFGGPAAHLGYFRAEFVSRRKWLSDSAYADLVAMSQFLPGPASSKVGMALGYGRAGLLGLIYSWFLFTFPSALILTLFGLLVAPNNGWIQGILGGLLAAAAGVVVHAIVGMAKKLLLTPTAWALALISAAVLLVAGSAWQLAVLAVAGVLGATVLRTWLLSLIHI